MKISAMDIYAPYTWRNKFHEELLILTIAKLKYSVSSNQSAKQIKTTKLTEYIRREPKIDKGNQSGICPIWPGIFEWTKVCLGKYQLMCPVRDIYNQRKASQDVFLRKFRPRKCLIITIELTKPLSVFSPLHLDMLVQLVKCY